MQADGNFCVYVSNHAVSSNAIWCSNTKGKGTGPYKLQVQEDGNGCIYDSKNAKIWCM